MGAFYRSALEQYLFGKLKIGFTARTQRKILERGQLERFTLTYHLEFSVTGVTADDVALMQLEQVLGREFKFFATHRAGHIQVLILHATSLKLFTWVGFALAWKALVLFIKLENTAVLEGFTQEFWRWRKPDEFTT